MIEVWHQWTQEQAALCCASPCELKENKMSDVENQAIFLVEKTGSVLSTWKGKLTDNEQRSLFGQAIGKGAIVIDGDREIIANRVKVCFGLD